MVTASYVPLLALVLAWSARHIMPTDLLGRDGFGLGQRPPGLGSAYRAHPDTFGEGEGVAADERTAGGVLPYCSNYCVYRTVRRDPLAR